MNAALSVVVIGRNEAANIARLLESVLRETSALPSEVVVVDSASTDGMAEVAARYPVEVLRLSHDQPLSAAAGRYVGFAWSTGEHILFLDGDMELHPGWLDRGLGILAEHRDAGVVTGRLLDPAADISPDSGEALSEVRFAGGAALYRRDILDRVGCFNPYLRSDEEPELCLRIRQAGYRVLSTSHPIAYHSRPHTTTLPGLVQRWRRGLFLGSGQNLRYLGGTPLLWPYVRERGYGIVPGLVALAGLLAAGRSPRAMRWLLLVPAALLADVVRRRGDIHRTAFAVVRRALITEATVRGFLMKPRPASSYPARFEVVRSSRS